MFIMNVWILIGVTLYCRLVLTIPLTKRVKRSGSTNSVYDKTWSAWGPCSPACGGGTQQRTLGCSDINGVYNAACITTSASCNLMPCDDPYVWGEWKQCSSECQQDQSSKSGTRRRLSTLKPGVHQVINCNVHSCQPASGCGKADLLFVLDSSGSVGELNWYRTKQFVLDVISGLTIGPDDTHLGIVTFSTEVSVPVKLGQYGTSEELRQKIWDIPYMAGATNTADALREMRAMHALHGRDDVKAIVVVITDGESNIEPQTTVPEADLCRDAAMTLFAIGVGSANHEELKGIANAPDSEYYYYVDEYEGLHSIVKTIVTETCDTANQVQCGEWADWTDCSVPCGWSGIRTRSRDCQMVDYFGDVTKEFTKSEEQVCVTESCTTSTSTTTPQTPAPTTSPTGPPTNTPTNTPITSPPRTTPSGPAPNCSLCEFHDNTGYLQNQADCGAYIECVKVKKQGSTSYKVYYRQCAPSLYWSPKYLTCVRTAPDSGCTILISELTTPGSSTNTPGTDEPYCPFKKDPLEPSRFFYQNNGQKTYYKCAPDMELDEQLCVCMGIPSVVECNSELLLHFPFDLHFNDVTCNRAKSDIYGSPELVDDSTRPSGKVAYFDGNSRLTVSFLHNWFAGHQVDKWTISVWIKQESGSGSSVSGLVNNGDCRWGPSFQVYVTGNTATGGIQTDTGVMAEAQPINIRIGEWEHIVMVYDGQEIIMYLNGAKAEGWIQQNGHIANRQCPMNIAHEGLSAGSGYFRGYMDELRIYKRALTDEEVMELFESF